MADGTTVPVEPPPTADAPVALPAALDTRRPMPARVLALALPALAQQFLVLLVGLSDRYLAGHLPDATASLQSAQTTANYLGWFLSSTAVAVSVGATAVVAHAVGAGDRARAVRAAHQALLIGAVVGVGGGVGGSLLLLTFVQLLGLSEPAAGHAVAFLRPMFWLLPIQVVEAAAIASLVGAGDTRTGLYIRFGVVMLNLPLAWGLCFGVGDWPGLGFAGIAWGTALSHALGGVAALVALAAGRAGLTLDAAQLAPAWPVMRRILSISVPAALDSFSVIAGQMWFLAIVNALGDTASAAHGIALGWEALGYQAGSAFGTAATALVGQCLGARRPADAARAGWTAFLLGGAVMVTMGALFFAAAPAMFGLFCPRPEQRPIIDAGVPALRLVAFAMPALASTMILTAALRGAGDARVPVLFTWAGFLLVRIPLAYALTGPLGLLGAWVAMAADLYVRGAFAAWRFAGGRWAADRLQ